MRVGLVFLYPHDSFFAVAFLCDMFSDWERAVLTIQLTRNSFLLISLKVPDNGKSTCFRALNDSMVCGEGLLLQDDMDRFANEAIEVSVCRSSSWDF